jgi:hypothetical protein
VSGVPWHKRVLFWLLAPLLVGFGLLCVAFPLVQLSSLEPGAHLIDDTRAAYGAGTTDDVPVVESVLCVREQYGTSGRRGFHSVEYDCEFDLVQPRAEAERPNPYHDGMTPAEQQAAYEAEMAAYFARLAEVTRPRGPLDPPSSVSRTLPRTAMGRPLPTLRRLSDGGEPPRYGLVFPDGGLAGRWGHWGAETLVFWAFAFGCFLATRVMWQRVHPPRAPR